MYGYLSYLFYIVIYYIYTVASLTYITLAPHLFNLTTIPKLYPSGKRVIFCILKPSIHATHKRKILAGTRKYTPSIPKPS